MDKSEIMKILPHRDGMLLVDEAFVENGVAKGKYHVRGDEWFLQGISREILLFQALFSVKCWRSRLVSCFHRIRLVPLPILPALIR